MAQYVYKGTEEVYVPDVGAWVKPGESIEFPDKPNNALFEPEHHHRPASAGKKQED